MKNLTAIVGSVGSGKSRLLLKKIQELSNEYEYVFAVDLDYNYQDVPELGNATVVLFDTVEEMMEHMEANKVAPKNVALLVDNASITINEENIKELKAISFAKTIVSLQAHRNSPVETKALVEAQNTISQRWNLTDVEEIEVIPVVRPSQNQ